MKFPSKTKFAFECNVDTVFGDRKQAYFWTFTFADMPEIEDAAECWRRFVNWLVRHDPKVYGVRVYELHEDHGIHLHALVNRRLSVYTIRAATKRYGLGRIHVKMLPRTAADYLSKYLTQQDRTAWLKHKRLWACFGHFPTPRSLVKNIVIESNFTRAVAFCQQELKTRKLPYLFVTALMHAATDNPKNLKQACWILKTCGPNFPLIQRALRE